MGQWNGPGWAAGQSREIILRGGAPVGRHDAVPAPGRGAWHLTLCGQVPPLRRCSARSYTKARHRATRNWAP